MTIWVFETQRSSAIGRLTGLPLAPAGPLSDVERSLIRESAMSAAIARLNAAPEGRYTIERELGEGGMATV